MGGDHCPAVGAVHTDLLSVEVALQVLPGKLHPAPEFRSQGHEELVVGLDVVLADLSDGNAAGKSRTLWNFHVRGEVNRIPVVNGDMGLIIVRQHIIQEVCKDLVQFFRFPRQRGIGAGGFLFVMQNSHELALSPAFMGIESAGLPDVPAPAALKGNALCRVSAYTLPHGDQLKLRMQIQEVIYHHLVLLQGEGAGGIDDISSLLHCRGGALQDLLLPLGAMEHILRAPFINGVFILAEHPLAGARGVHHHKVKGFRKELCDLRRGHTGGNGIAKAQSLHVAGQNAAAGGDDLIGNENALLPQFVAQLTALAAGCGAQIQHPPVRVDVQTLRRRHGAWVLDVDHAGMVGGVVADFIIVQIIPRLHIGDLLLGKDVDLLKVLQGDLIGIHPESPDGALPKRGLIGFVLRSQQCLHPGDKGFRQRFHSFSPPNPISMYSIHIPTDVMAAVSVRRMRLPREMARAPFSAA